MIQISVLQLSHASRHGAGVKHLAGAFIKALGLYYG